MRYTKFIIENYKGIQKLTLDLDKQPSSKVITLVGLNESGKTSLLEAINLLQKDFNEIDCHKLIPKKDKLKFTGSVKVSGYHLLNKEDNSDIKNFVKQIGIIDIKPLNEIIITKEYNFIDSKFIEKSSKWIISLKIKLEGSNEFIDAKDENWQKIVGFIRDSLIPKILYYPNFLFDFPNKIYLDEETSKEKNQLQFRDVIQDILSAIDKDLTIDKHLINRLDDSTAGVQESLEHTLSKMSSEISKVVLGAWKNIMNIKGREISVEAKSEISDIPTKNASGQVIMQNKKRYYLEFKLKEGTEKYFISERSLGFKWFFTFLLFTEFRKNRQTDIGETLFLLDEPASNLHSTAQKKLLDKFSDLVTKCRLIYTTHSHHLINPLWLCGTYIIKNEAINYKKGFDFDTNNTNIKAILYKQFVSSNPKQQDYFQPILDALDYQPGLLEKIPKIIITEGKFDYYIFMYIIKVVLKNKYNELRFYPGNGADSNDQLIRLYIAWGRIFKILLDGDEGGERAKKRYIKMFDKSIEETISTFLDIDSTFVFPVEGLFSDDEKLKITRLFDGNAISYDKSKFNTAIQIAYINKQKIDLSEATLGRFEKIFKTL